jgi:hypothetical protein
MRLLHRIALSLVLALSLASPAASQSVPGEWAPGYAMPGLGVRVYAVTVWQGQLVAGGYYLMSGGRYLGSVAVYDGVSWQPLGANPDGKVRAFAQVGGELYAAGTFDSAGGQPAQNIARWDGKSWKPLGSGLQPIGVNPSVVALALAEYQGELWAGGIFSAAGGVPCNNLARWDGTQWHAIPGGVQGPGMPAVRAFLVEGDVIHVAGEFTSAGFVTANNIARFDGTSWSKLGSGLSSWANAMVRYQGDLYVGGYFAYAGGQSAPKIARWNGSSWSGLAGGIPDFTISPHVASLAVHDGELFVGGNFVWADNVFTRRLARWNGSAWAPADGLVGTDLATTAIAMTTWNGMLVVGGEFVDAGDPPDPGVGVCSTMIVGYDDGRWFPLGKGMGIDAEVRTLTRWNGRWIIGGRFLNAGNAFALRVAAFDGVAYEPIGSVDNGEVWESIEYNGDLVITGSFKTINGQSMPGVARYDGKQWHSMTGAGGYSLAVHQNELYAGGVGGVRRWTGSGWTSVGTIYGIVNDMYSHGGLLWIGGDFNWNSGPGPYLAVWDGVNLSSAPGGVPNNWVDALGSWQGQLVVGGTFSSIGGKTASHVARWDGTSWNAMGSGIGGPSSFTVHSFAELNGRLYAGGSFTKQGGSPGQNVLRWNGLQWLQLQGGGLDGWVHDMEVLPSTNSILMVGGFLTTMGSPVKYSVHMALWSEGGGAEGIPFCTGGFAHACPCGNDPSEGSGCVNSTGAGAKLAATGSTGVAANDLTLTTSGLPPAASAIAFVGQKTMVEPFAFSSGLLCIASPVMRLPPVSQANGAGTIVRSSLAGSIQALLSGAQLAGSTWHVQDWYRDPTGPCGTTNLSNGLSFTFTP